MCKSCDFVTENAEREEVQSLFDYVLSGDILFDTGPDSVFSIYENGCGGSIPDTLYTYSQIIDSLILDQTIDNFYYKENIKKKSMDPNDFDISFAKGLSLEDGAATITELTADIISKKLPDEDIFVCGGGRKNKFLIDSIKRKIENKILQIDNLGIDGNFIESQAFGYLAIRSYLGLPISFPETTGCKKPCKGGIIVKNF